MNPLYHNPNTIEQELWNVSLILLIPITGIFVILYFLNGIDRAIQNTIPLLAGWFAFLVFYWVRHKDSY